MFDNYGQYPFSNAVLTPLHLPPPQYTLPSLSTQANYGTSPTTQYISDEELRALLPKIAAKKPSSPSPKLNVSTVAILLSGYKRLLLSTERGLKYLEVTKKNLSEDDWLAKCQDLDKKKALLMDMEKQLADPYFVELVRKTVKRVQTKRNRMKRKRRLWKEQKREMKESRVEKNRQIDLWLEKMEDEVERTRREEVVKKEADLVLSDVVRKKSEAKRMLSLLNSLTKLRNAKVTQASSSNKPASLEETRTFELVIDKLKKLWVNQLKEYNLEEQGLKVMLNDAQVERVNIEEKTWKKTLQTWTNALFGVNHITDPLQSQPSDPEFTLVRNDWDNFICAEDNPLASSIPIGWVVPVEPSSAGWCPFL